MGTQIQNKQNQVLLSNTPQIMKYTSILVACLSTAGLVVTGESLEYKRQCNAFLSKSHNLVSQNNNARGRRSVFGRRKGRRGNEAPFIVTTADSFGSGATTVEVSTAGITTEKGSITIVTTQAATTNPTTTTIAATTVLTGMISDDPTSTSNALTTTTNPTTAVATTAVATPAVATPEAEPESETPPEYVIVLDETGSMQSLGGKRARNGREIVITKFNRFLNLLKKKINDEEIVDGKFTFVTFNRKARFVNFDSLLDMPALTRQSYNPGYGTNLYDTLACLIAKMRSEQPDTDNVKFYVISDGAHKLAGKKDKKFKVGYETEELNEGVTEAREFGWNFNFYGSVNDGAEKDKLKEEVLSMGFRETERKMFDFTGGDMNKLLKSLLGSMSKKGEVKKVECTKPGAGCLVECKEFKKCQKGKAGKWCRKSRKSAEAQGKCKFY